MHNLRLKTFMSYFLKSGKITYIYTIYKGVFVAGFLCTPYLIYLTILVHYSILSFHVNFNIFKIF